MPEPELPSLAPLQTAWKLERFDQSGTPSPPGGTVSWLGLPMVVGFCGSVTSISKWARAASSEPVT